MCMLLKLDYAKFGVSNLFLSKVIEEKPSGGGVGSTPLGTGRVNANIQRKHQLKPGFHQMVTH